MSYIKPKKGIALYYQIKEHLEDQINSGTWEPGAQIPNEMDLAELFGVSRMTVRRAILELVQNGQLITKQGSGTFVSEKKWEGNFIKFFYPDKFGKQHKLLELSQISCPMSIAQKLNIDKGELVTQVFRIRLFNDIPAVIEKSYLGKEIFSQLKQEDLSGKLYDLIERKYDIRLISAKTSLEPVILSDFEADILDVDIGSPALLLTRVAYTYNEEPVIYTKNIIRGDKCRLLITE